MSARSAVSRLRFAALMGTATIALAAGSASAQDTRSADDPAVGESQGPLGEIVVTAERRATNLQDTPLSVVAMTEEMVTAKGIEDLQDLAVFTPNLSISASRGNGNNIPNFTIRGISGGGVLREPGGRWSPRRSAGAPPRGAPGGRRGCPRERCPTSGGGRRPRSRRSRRPLRG